MRDGVTIRMPALVALRAFEAAARLGSQRKAAEELRVDHTVVGKHIRGLEADLGVALMRSSASGTVLTPLGREYYARVAQALDILGTATERLRERGASPTLHVACSPGFAVRWLTPRVSRFLESHAGLDIAIRPTNRPPGLTNGEVDVDVRYTGDCEPGLRCRELCRPRVFPVCSPEWLTRHGPIDRPEQLLSAALVHEETHEHWRLWLRLAGVAVSEPPPGPRFWNAALALDAARMGQGVALANELIAGDELRAGQLVEVLSSRVVIHPYAFLARGDRWEEPVIAEFLSWLIATIGNEQDG